MFDIAKHKWSDSSVQPNEDSVYSGDTLHLYCGYAGEISIKKEDAIAIAKHFGIYKETELCVFGEVKSDSCGYFKRRVSKDE